MSPLIISGYKIKKQEKTSNQSKHNLMVCLAEKLRTEIQTQKIADQGQNSEDSVFEEQTN